MRTHHFRCEQTVPGSLEDVFDFFSRARNLEKITPPWLHFRILNEGEIEMRPGTRIDYRLRLHGIPFQWQSEITVWEPPHRFVDVQTRGPYRLWRHEHRFEGGETTTILDQVEYAVWGPSILQEWFVAPRIREIFDFRKGQIDRILGKRVARPANTAGSGP